MYTYMVAQNYTFYGLKQVIKIIIQNKYKFQKLKMFLKGIILISQYLNTSQKKDKIKLQIPQNLNFRHMCITYLKGYKQ